VVSRFAAPWRAKRVVIFPRENHNLTPHHRVSPSIWWKARKSGSATGSVSISMETAKAKALDAERGAPVKAEPVSPSKAGTEPTL